MRLAIIGLGVLTVLTGNAYAQTDARFVQAFSGSWVDYDQAQATGQITCKVQLSQPTAGSVLVASATDCRPPLSNAKTWGIEKNQLIFYDDQHASLVTLGGNQKRITGETTNGQPIVLERLGGDGNAALLQAAYNASGCYFLGYSQACAPKPELVRPVAGSDGAIHILPQVDIVSRAEPRADAQSVGVLPKNICVKATACVVASDGPWCEVSVSKSEQWVRKLVLRQNRWPAVSFTNGCGP